MIRVFIYGAGSIGNHLAHACRNKGWGVTMTDLDSEALRRTREEIYPARYGKWDDTIKLVGSGHTKDAQADLVIIGTPPDTHMALALEAIRTFHPKVVLIEKPLCTPDLKGYQEVAKAAASAGVTVLTGYNHVKTRNTDEAEKILASGAIGKPLSLSVRWLEHWGGIFGAHPWLSGPSDTYLGFSTRGGGACGEHSHGINIFQHFARLLGAGRIAELSCVMDHVKDGKAAYDRVCLINVITDSGLTGSISQDVVTHPSVKTLRVQGDKGYLEWYANYDGGHDAVIWASGKDAARTVLVPKKRPDDFAGEINEVEAVLAGKSKGDAMSLQAGYETMCVIAAAYRSSEERKFIKPSYA